MSIGNTGNADAFEQRFRQRAGLVDHEALMAAGVASKAKNSEEAIQNYTTAVASYDEGLAADADQPAILTNKAVALKGRGGKRFNATITSKTWTNSR